MPKDISQYIDFNSTSLGFPVGKRSFKSLLNIPIIIEDWELLESRFAGASTQQFYVRLLVKTSSGRYLVNTGNVTIMSQLEQVGQAKAEANEQDMAFTCIVQRHGRGYRLGPVNWERKDVRSQMGEEAIHDDCSAEGD